MSATAWPSEVLPSYVVCKGVMSRNSKRGSLEKLADVESGTPLQKGCLHMYTPKLASLNPMP